MEDDKNFNDPSEEFDIPVNGKPTVSIPESKRKPAPTPDLSQNEDLLEELKNSVTLVKVLGQDLIIISADKIRLAYSAQISTIKMKGGWVAPVGLFVSLLLALLTASFSDSFGITSATWKAFFMLGCVLTFIWSIVAIYKELTAPKLEDAESFIRRITIDKNHG